VVIEGGVNAVNRQREPQLEQLDDG
jgi:hypothetical protein